MQIILQFFKEMSSLRLGVTAILTLAFMVLFGVYLKKINNSDYEILYSDLELQDSAKVVQELENKKIEYTATGDGSIIKVHKLNVAKARLSLAHVGLPNSGSVIGYEIFDEKDAIGATNFSQNIKLIRALEGELSRTISAFEQIDKARVHLVMPQREIFSKEKIDPRASVVLKFKGSKKLGKSEIDAISHLVVTAVPGLEMKSVTIVDTRGRALKIGSAEEDSDFIGAKNEDARIAAEERLRQIIEGLLASTLGLGKVKARVALEMNFDREVINSELFDPESAVIRSVQSVDEHEKTPITEGSGSDASVANNIPGGSTGSDENSKFATIDKSDSTTNYEISKTVKNHISESGKIKKMSIGILVDGIYQTKVDSLEKEYLERPKEELDKIANLVKVAVGFDEARDDKIEVINMKFSDEFEPMEENTSDWIREELPNLFQTLIFAIVVLLVLITVIRPIALKAFEVKKHGDEGASMLPEISSNTVNQQMDVPESVAISTSIVGGDVSGAPDGGKSIDNPIQKINELVEAAPEDVVNVLRKWLNEGS